MKLMPHPTISTLRLRVNFLVDVVQVLPYMVDSPEEQRAVNADDLQFRAFDFRFNQRWADNIWIRCQVGDARMGGAVQVKDQGEQNTRINGELQIQEQGGQKGGQQDCRFLSAGFQDGANVMHVDEMVGHQQDDSPHGRDGQVGGQWGDEQKQQGQQKPLKIRLKAV
jgi:hypothetical protein